MTDSARDFPELLNDCHDSVQEVGPDGTILRVNRAWRETLGYDETEIRSLNILDVIQPECQDHCREQFGRVIHGEAVKNVEATLRAKDGHSVAILGSCRCLFDGDQALSCFGMFHDITQRRQAEEALQRKEAELEQRVRERTEELTKLNEALSQETHKLATTNAELKRSNEDLEHFAFIAAHDLRAPLHHVAAYADLLMRRYGEQLDAVADQCLQSLVNATERMREMLDSLLQYSQCGIDPRDPELVESGKILQRALNNLSSDIRKTGATVTSAALPVVTADRSQLLRLFQNLISNAIKYHSADPPVIHVACEQNAGEWEFTIRDNGVGIDPKHSDRIFELFARLHSEQEYPGTGIGLAICKRIVECHGGRIWTTPNPDQGTTFRFTLPASDR